MRPTQLVEDLARFVNSDMDGSTNDENLDLLTFLPRTDRLAFNRKDRIYDRVEHANYLYLVNSGLVLVAESVDGVVIDICGQEDFFGFRCLSNVAKYLEHAEAVTDVEIMKWSRQELADLLRKDLGASLALAKVLADNLARANERIKSFGKEQISARLLRLLLYLGERYYEHDGEVILPHITHEVIARYLGTSREIVTSTLNDFKRRKMLDYAGRGNERGIRFKMDVLSYHLFGEDFGER